MDIEFRHQLDTFLDEITAPDAEVLCLIHEELRALDSGLSLNNIYGVRMFIKRWEYSALA